MSYFATELGGIFIIVIVIIVLSITDYISDYVDELEYRSQIDDNNTDIYCILSDFIIY